MRARRLLGRVVVVTGASSGIGRACALQLGTRGAHVVVAARRADLLDDTARQIAERGGRALAVRTDVTQRHEVQRLLDATLEHFGRVDAWVNNAGAGLAARVAQLAPVDFEAMLAVNLMGAVHGSQVALAAMDRQGAGHIVNVASLVVYFPLPVHSAYTAAKCGLAGFTRALAVEAETSGVDVSLVLPGVTDTGFTDVMERRLPDVDGWSGPAASADRVAEGIVSCIVRPRPLVVFVPGGRLTLALNELLPGLWRRVAREYLRRRLRA